MTSLTTRDLFLYAAERGALEVFSGVYYDPKLSLELDPKLLQTAFMKAAQRGHAPVVQVVSL
jgi:hypothetical protein